MKTFPNLIICDHCDSVYARRPLARREVASCTRCDAVLYRAERLGVDGRLALTLAAAVAFVVANTCPVIRISVQGMHGDTTLWQSAAALARGAAAPIALPAALATVVVPFVQICLLMWILGYARVGRRAPGFTRTMRVLDAIRPWSMVEVGLLGILVAAVKLAGFVQVAPGPGIWATAGLTVCLSLVAGRDLHALWDLAAPAAHGGEVCA
jgi:paraquat-inducible protein A